MHILIIADGRSPTALRWINSLLTMDYEVSLISTFPCEPPEGIKQFRLLPVAFARFSGSQITTKKQTKEAFEITSRKGIISRLRNLFYPLRHRLGPLTVRLAKRKLQKLVYEINPDLVHALRIPFEGMLGSFTPGDFPFVTSIWGNDLTFHAHGSNSMADATVRTLKRANGLISDTHRDIRLAHQWQYHQAKPTLVIPGCSGLNLMEISRRIPEEESALPTELKNSDRPIIINPRGFRPGSVRNEMFFQSIPFILKKIPDAVFLCPGMAGQTEALDWISYLEIEDSVYLLPYLQQKQLWDLYYHAQVMATISDHDGTPNSLLEAMSCGCFPVAGDIESIREWITPGVNGLLVETEWPERIAETILLALQEESLRKRAADINRKIIRERAEAQFIQAQIGVFYQQFLDF